MAIYYVWSAAAGSANGTTWANAYTTLATAFSGKAAGDSFYVAHDHAELTSGPFLFCTGTRSNPTKIICVNRAGSVPPVSADRRTTAQIASSANTNIVFGSGSAHYDGVVFIAGNSTGTTILNLANTSGIWNRFDNCSLQLGSTGAAATIDMPILGGTHIELNNTTMSFSAVGQKVNVGAIFKWRGTPSALIGAQVPTILLAPLGGGASVECIGVDFSAAGSGKTIVGASATAVGQQYNFIDCKLNAAVTKSAVPLAHGATEIDFVRCGASGINYAIFRHRISGTLDQETTIVRTGGASDGTTSISWKVVTTANCLYSLPFECPPIAIWNDITGAAVTATIEGIWGGGAVPNDDDVWVDVEYLGDASSPQGSFVNDGKADLLATAAGQTASSATWGGSTTKFKLNVTFAPQQKGWVYARVKCAKASSTFYIDPLVTLT